MEAKQKQWEKKLYLIHNKIFCNAHGAYRWYANYITLWTLVNNYFKQWTETEACKNHIYEKETKLKKKKKKTAGVKNDILQ